MRYLTVGLAFVALSSGGISAETPLASFCYWHPTDVLCAEPPPVDPCIENPTANDCPCPDDDTVLYPNCPVEPPPIDPEKPVTVGHWEEIPNSAMDSVYIEGVDDMVPRYGGTSWKAIQSAFSGGVCARDELYVWGGGHAGGSHNGLLSVNPSTGVWTRVTEPSNPVGDCNDCGSYPDGEPTARHTYNLLATDGDYIYSSGGSIYSRGNAGLPPHNWRFDLDTMEWETYIESGHESVGGQLMQVDGTLYQAMGTRQSTYDINTNTWTEVSKNGNPVPGGALMQVYHEPTDTFYAFGNARVQWQKRSDFGNSWNKIEPVPVGLQYKGPGVVLHGDLIIIWTGGPVLMIYDIAKEAWGQIYTDTDPGSAFNAGTYGRMSSCGGEIILINGAGNNMLKLHLPDVINYEPITEFISVTTAQSYVDDGLPVPPGIYLDGVQIRDGYVLDMMGVRFLDGFKGKGKVLVIGEGTVKNAMLDDRFSCLGCAGVRGGLGSVITIDNTTIRNQENAVLTGNDSVSLRIINSILEDNFTNGEAGHSHNVYAGKSEEFHFLNSFSGCYINKGHSLKMRSKRSYIIGSTIDQGNCNNSRLIDNECGGYMEIRNSSFIHSPNSDNTDMISMAVGGCRDEGTVSKILLENTYWRASPDVVRFMTTKETVEFECLGTNTFEGIASPCV